MAPSSDRPDARIASPVWQAARPLLDQQHTPRRCPTRVAPYSTGDPDGKRLHETCRSRDCLGIFHDLYCRVEAKVRKAAARAAADGVDFDPVRVAYAAAANLVRDLLREQRASTGVARPQRRDGVIGRIGHALPSAWLDELLTLVLAYAGAAAPLTRCAWPYQAWAGKKGEHLGTSRAVSVDEIRADVDHVLSVAAAIAGRRWVHDNITSPLQRRQPPTSLPVEQGLEEGDQGADIPRIVLASPTPDPLIVLLDSAYAKRRGQGQEPRPAARAAVADVYGDVDDDGAKLPVFQSRSRLDRLAAELEDRWQVSAPKSA